jgi:hypothetical protein
MSQQAGFHDLTYTAGANLSAKQYHFLRFSADYTVNTPGAAAQDIIGIQQDDLATAAGIGVLVRPIPQASSSLLKAGAAIAAGAPITSDANGKGVTATTGQRYYARAAQAATADGDIIEVHPTTGNVP